MRIPPPPELDVKVKSAATVGSAASLNKDKATDTMKRESRLGAKIAVR
jgi:hypothetical protein